MSRLVVLFILFSTSCFGTEERCHLGERDIKDFKSCNVDMRHNSSSMILSKKDTLSSVYYCSDIGDIGKYTFYSNRGRLNIDYVKNDGTGCGGRDLENASTIRIKLTKKSAEPIIGFSKSLPIEDVERIDFGFKRKKRLEKPKKADGTEELSSYGLSFKDLKGDLLEKYERKIKKLSHENRSFTPKHYKADQYKGLKMYNERWFGGKYEYAEFNGFTFVRSFQRLYKGREPTVLLMFIFDSKDNIFLVKTPIDNQENVYFVPIYKFSLYGIKYYLFHNRKSNGFSGKSIIFEIDGKGYYRELGSFRR